MLTSKMSGIVSPQGEPVNREGEVEGARSTTKSLHKDKEEPLCVTKLIKKPFPLTPSSFKTRPEDVRVVMKYAVQSDGNVHRRVSQVVIQLNQKKTCPRVCTYCREANAATRRPIWTHAKVYGKTTSHHIHKYTSEDTKKKAQGETTRAAET